MIRDVLAPVLEREFRDRDVQLDALSNVVATFPAVHPEVGDVTVWDDGDEVTVGIREITHTHFEPAEASLSAAAMAEQITADVVAFLRDLFADRILLWRATSGGSAGWELLEGKPEHAPDDGAKRWFLWSGPLR